MKRWLSCLVMVITLFNLCVPVSAANSDYAEAVFDSAVARCTNMSATLTNEIAPTLAEKNGITGWILNPDVTNESYIRFNIDDDFLSNLSYGETVYVDVTYYDENYGGFSIYYDSVDGRNSKFVQLENTLEWKSFRFTLNDAYFGNRLKTSDFEIITNLDDEMGKSASNVIIGSVKIEKANTIAPFKISAESEKYGNIFFEEDDILIDVKYQNMAGGSHNVNVTYDIIDINGQVVYTFNSVLDIVSTAEEKISIPTIPYGVYEFSVTVSGDGVYQTEVFDFSRAKKADTLNFRLGTNAHYERSEYTKDDVKEITDLIKNAGYGFVRSSLKWHTIEKEKGEYKIPENVKYANEYVDELGMEMLAIVYTENSLYDSWPYYLESAESREAFKKYCNFVASDLKDVTDYFCMLNEYNYSPGGTEAQYLEVAKAGYTGIKNANPNAFINGGSLAGPARDYRTKLFMKGFLKYCDSFSIHLYSTDTESEVDWLTEEGEKLKSDMSLYSFFSGSGKKQAWVTESGWPTRDFEDAKELQFANYEQQAKYLARQLIIENNQDRLSKWFNYSIQDYNGKDYFNKENHYGILHAPDYRTPNAAKPSYIAICAFNDIIGTATAYGNMNNKDNGYAHKFVNDKEEEIFCIWKSSEQSSGEYKFVTDKPYIEIYDMYGNLTTVNNTSGGYTVPFTENPVYVKGTDKIPDVMQNGEEVDCLWYADGDNYSVSFVPYESEKEEINVICAMYKNDVLSHTLINTEKNTGDEIISEFVIDNSDEYDSVRFFVFDGTHSIVPLTPEKRVDYYGDSKNINITKTETGFNISGIMPDKKVNENVILTIYKNDARKDVLNESISASDIIYVNNTITDEAGQYSFSVENIPESFVVIVSNKYSSQQKLYK